MEIRVVRYAWCRANRATNWQIQLLLVFEFAGYNKVKFKKKTNLQDAKLLIHLLMSPRDDNDTLMNELKDQRIFHLRRQLRNRVESQNFDV
jgi:hypothetical protein